MSHLAVNRPLVVARRDRIASMISADQACLCVTGLVVVLWITVALFYATGPIASDDLGYLEFGRLSVSPETASQVHYSYARFGFWLPLRWVGDLLGASRLTFIAVPLVSALAALGLTGMLARAWMGNWAMPAALLSLGFVPLFSIFSTVSVPDTMGAMILAAGLMLLAPPLVTRGIRRPLIRCLAGGVVVGLSFMAKETVILLCPALALFVLVWRRRQGWAWQRLLFIAVGAAVGLGIEMIILYRLTGDPLFHIRSITAGCREYGSPIPDHRWPTLLWYMTDYVRLMASPGESFGTWGVVYLLAILYAMRVPTDYTRLLLCCVFIIGGYLSVGSADPFSYFPVYHQARYVITLLPLGALLTTHMAVTVARRGPPHRRTVLGVVALLTLASLLRPDESAGKLYYASTFEAGRMLFERQTLTRLPDATLAGSPEAVHRLDFLVTQNTGKPLLPVDDPQPETPGQWQARYPHSYVLITARDRRTKHRPPPGRLLSLASQEALSSFTRVASAAPPAGRINHVLSRLGLVSPKSDHAARIDVYYIPGTTDDG